MYWISGITCVAAVLAGTASTSPVSAFTAADSSVYKDPETGFTFSSYNAQYQFGKTITYRIALPSPVSANSPYDVVIQVVAPVDVGWAGLAWGGSMINNPLSVGWANGNSAMVGSRHATDHTTPSTYSGATYTLFTKGTHKNGTHWQYTAKCSGCTSFSASTGRTTYLNPSGSNRLAFAESAGKPSSPSSPSSSFPVHDVTGYWNHDFSSAGNTQFTALVATNS